MSCEKFSDLMMKYFDGNISSKEDECLKEHIKSCTSCGAEFKSLSDIFNCYEEDVAIEPPEGFEASVMEKVREYDELRRKRLDRNLMIVYASTFVMMGIISLITLVFLKNGVFEGSFVKNGGIRDVLWEIAFFAYNIMINIYLLIKNSISSYGSYYLFTTCLIIYLITHNSIIAERTNAKKTAGSVKPS
ncbi:MAG TPA: zf-HC2 domain-containing protein [Pseudobacteroides sp.]|nr:zf-HC2 domain-containing protein [Pseudobacteroides sp.]